MIILAAARWPHWLGWLDHDFVLKIKYEDLRLRPAKTVQEIFQFAQSVGILDQKSLIAGAQPAPGNPTFRRGTPGDWKTDFEPHHKEMATELLEDVIEKLGYEV